MLKLLDFYGEKIQLNINNKTTGQTNLGGILFLLTIILLGFSSWFIGKDIYFKKNPVNNQQTIISGNYPQVNLNRSSFPIAVSLADFDGFFIEDPRYLQIKFLYYEYSTVDGSLNLLNSSSLEADKCKYEDFPNLDRTFFDNYKMYKFLCPQKPINLHGYWSEPSMNYLSVTVCACDYDMYPDYCATKEDIDKFIATHSININLGILDPIISFDNYENPITPVFSTPYISLTDQLKMSSMLIQQNQIFTDGGFFLEDYSITNYLKAVTLFDDSTLFSPVRKEYANIDFYSSNQFTVTYRRYIKIPDILAFVGGIMKLINFLFLNVNLKFSQVSKNCTIIENLFDFSNDIENYNSFNSNKNIKEILHSKYHHKIENVNSFENFKPKSGIKKLQLSRLDYFKIVCNKISKQSLNVKIYEKGSLETKNYFNMLLIIRLIHEFQFFKNKILSKVHLQELNMYKPSLRLFTDPIYSQESCIKRLSVNKPQTFNKLLIFPKSTGV